MHTHTHTAAIALADDKFDIIHLPEHSMENASSHFTDRGTYILLAVESMLYHTPSLLKYITPSLLKYIVNVDFDPVVEYQAPT